MMQWLLNGMGLNKTTFAAISGIIGGLGLIFTGSFNEGVTIAIISLQQLTQRWSTNPSTALLFQRTFWGALGGVCTGVYMITQGNITEGFLLLMASLEALFQRQAKKKLA
jgi:hypothetical protein